MEWALLAHPAVRECAVVGAADPERGTIVKACVVLAPGRAGDIALVKELQDFVKQRIAPYKYPRVIEFLEALPKTATGKLPRKPCATEGTFTSRWSMKRASAEVISPAEVVDI